MENKIKEITIEQNKIDKKAAVIANNINEEAIFDGIISPEDYLKSKIHIAWLLREPHDGGSWDYKSALVDRSKEAPHKHRFFDKIRYVQYSIKNNFILWNDIPNSDENEEVHKSFLDACFININKIGGYSTIDKDTFPKYVSLFKDLTMEQIHLAKPDLIICSGTYSFVKDWFSEEEQKKLIDVYHISQRTISEQNFCDDIILKIKEKLKG